MVKQSIAVIGGGVAGIVSAFLLQERFDVTLFEKNQYLGGHTNTVPVQDEKSSVIPIDTGFIVCNDKTYPLFHRFIAKLGVKWRYADMSFSVVDEKTGLNYGSKNINTIFADRKNFFSPGYWRFLVGIQKFWNQAKQDLENQAIQRLSLREYIELQKIPDDVVQNFILPISAAIWSTPDKLMLDFPVGIFLKFYSNHGLLSVVNQPRWQTVVGGSNSYVKAFQKQFPGKIILDAQIDSVRRFADHIVVKTQKSGEQSFDYVVMATHADQVLGLLDDPTDQENMLFKKWSYLTNDTVLHTDKSYLPSNQRAQASWNYRRELHDDGSQPLSLSYHMNRLQGLHTDKEYIVTLNSRKAFDPAKVIARYAYTHPFFTVDAMETQPAIQKLNGINRTFFAGSYLRFGFHEDAIMSAAAIGEHFGVSL